VQTWTIHFIAENGVYLIEYPSSACGGAWAFVSETNGSFTFLRVYRKVQAVALMKELWRYY